MRCFPDPGGRACEMRGEQAASGRSWRRLLRHCARDASSRARSLLSSIAAGSRPRHSRSPPPRSAASPCAHGSRPPATRHPEHSESPFSAALQSPRTRSGRTGTKQTLTGRRCRPAFSNLVSRRIQNTRRTPGKSSHSGQLETSSETWIVRCSMCPCRELTTASCRADQRESSRSLPLLARFRS